MNGPAEAKGLKLRLGRWHFRLWKYGFEYGNQFGGTAMFFPWSPIFRKRNYDKR